jgi:hypothetical protein
MTGPVQDNLEAAGLAPGEHDVDSGYVSADLLVSALLLPDDRRVRRAGRSPHGHRLRASINVACRVAAGDRRTSYHATDERITIGIAGPDARERIAGLHRQLTRMGRNRGWTITEDLN